MRISNCFYITKPLSILLFPWLILACVSLNAETVDITSQKILKSSVVAISARDYSISHPGTIGVFINLMGDTKIRADQLSAAIGKDFKNRNVTSFITSQTSPNNLNEISTITFYVRGKVYPGFTFDLLKEGVGDITNILKAKMQLDALQQEGERLQDKQKALESAIGNKPN